jgi:hypothetical protein
MIALLWSRDRVLFVRVHKQNLALALTKILAKDISLCGVPIRHMLLSLFLNLFPFYASSRMLNI